jgi:hypothetical protein
LSWEKDYPMQEVVKDSLYQVTVTGYTGRICMEFKFCINGELELNERENRKLYFEAKKDTTKATYVFDKK